MNKEKVMSFNNKFALFILVSGCLLRNNYSQATIAGNKVVGGYYEPGISAAQILSARGYLTREFIIRSQDGYLLSIVRARNPLVNNGRAGLPQKEPILFIHGGISSAASFVTNSKGVRPGDFTNIQVNATSQEELIKLIGNEPASKTLPTLFLNFGYEVWLLNKRGTLESRDPFKGLNRTLVDAFISTLPTLSVNQSTILSRMSVPGKKLTLSDDLNEFLQPFVNLAPVLLDLDTQLRRAADSFDPKYWSYSLDEQAQFDVTASVEFILQTSSKRQVNLVAFSEGGAMILMKLSESPDFANKVARAVILSPTINLGHGDVVSFLAPLIGPLARAYVGPIPLPLMTEAIQATGQLICDFKATQYTLCESIYDLLFGPSGGQAPVTPSILANSFQPMALRELAHIGQFSQRERPRKFNFNTVEENISAYGLREPPIYDFSRIRLNKMSFYAGSTDTLVTVDDVRATLAQLSVPYRFTVVGGSGVFFNHAGYLLHGRVGQLVNIPILKDIEHILH